MQPAQYVVIAVLVIAGAWAAWWLSSSRRSRAYRTILATPPRELRKQMFRRRLNGVQSRVHLTLRWGEAISDPSEAEMRRALAELDTEDEEHPSCWLVDRQSGWALDAYESGLLLLENTESDDPARYMENVPRERVLELWLALATQRLELIEREPWKPGYGNPEANTAALPNWPFDQPPDAVAFTLRRIVLPAPGATARPILLVTHDAEDHSWQFLDGDAAHISDAAVVGMGEILRHDPTLAEIADLPPGWTATRETVGSPWTRRRRTANEPPGGA